MLAGKIQPTKIELIRLKRSMKVAEAVHKILEDKREVILKKLEEIVDAAEEALGSLQKALEGAYSFYLAALVRAGASKIFAIAATTPPRYKAEIALKRILDIDIPSLQLMSASQEVVAPYGFVDTTPELDQFILRMHKAFPLLAKAAELENTIIRLARELEKTQRLINALEYVIIPTYKERIKFISTILEEREREEFVRLKRVKAVISGGEGS
jgi:V/A-type H+-transporting ATPase subunit D